MQIFYWKGFVDYLLALIILDKWTVYYYQRQSLQELAMRNRQIIQYLLYPRFFNAHSVLYKGTYTVSFKLYNITKNNTITYAYPFPIKNASNFKNFDTNGQPSIHSDGNFSYCTHKYKQNQNRFEIVYEQQRKIIESQCIFRLDFQLSKQYNIFLNVKLLRKVTNSKSQEEAGLCVRKTYETKYEIINEQELELRKTSFSAYQRIKFKSSEFFSSIDLFICNFNYGHKYYRNKMQISNFFTNIDLHNNNSLSKIKERFDTTEKKTKKEDNLYRYELMKNFECGIPSFYYQLLKMIEEYRRLMIEYKNLHSNLQASYENINLPVSSLIDLEYIKMKDSKVSLSSLQIHYEVSSPQEILCYIFEEKEFMRKNIRCLRNQFCLLLTYQPEREFFHLVNASMNGFEEMEEKLFVKYVSDLSHIEDSSQNQLRIDNIFTFKREQTLWNRKIMNMPLFFVQNYQKKERNSRSSKKKMKSLTVFVHGYQGNSFDFQKAKNYLKQNNKSTHVLIIESITNEMNQSIEYLGKEAAEEVIRFIENTIINFNHINFIGFSLGGIIARSAFTHLQRYWNKFNMFITFSSPHLGISQCENSLVNIGIWYLIKVDKVKNLKQLNFQSVKFSQSTLAKLSKCQGLSQFKKVVLVCSKNDGFVPFYSTVLQSKRCERQQLKQLCQNIIKNIKHVERVEMLFDIQNSGTLDKLTGRRGHIQFLDNDYFLDIFFRLYAPSL